MDYRAVLEEQVEVLRSCQNEVPLYDTESKVEIALAIHSIVAVLKEPEQNAIKGFV